MAKLKLSRQLIDDAFRSPNNASLASFGQDRGFGGSVPDSSPVHYTNLTSGNRLTIFKGLPPTANDLRTSAFQQTQYNSTRPDDRLITFDYANLYSGYVGDAFTFKETPFATVFAAGTATWFAMMAWYSGDAQCFIVGDVSDLNGDGFIKLPKTNLIVGERYNIKPLKLILPFEYEYN